MGFPRARVAQKPYGTGDQYGFGGGWTVFCPVVRRNEVDEDVSIVVDFGEGQEETARMVCDAINEKLERDFCNSTTK